MAKNLTEVRLLNVPLENDYLHTLYFPNQATQESYFKSKTLHTMNNCTYQRKDNYIRFDECMDDIINSNYVMYKNSGFSDKWYYAFITKMEYKDDSVTLVYIETDVIQTWLFDYTVKPSFVEREHVNDDTTGIHTIPESVETGDYICNNFRSFSFGNPGVVVASTVDLKYMSFTSGSVCPGISGTVYNGVFSGVKYYYFPSTEIEYNGITRTGYECLTHTISCLASMGQSDAIISMFMVGDDLIERGSVWEVTVAGGDLPIFLIEVAENTTPKNLTWEITDAEWEGILKPVDVDGYVPKNNKLFTYPYSYILMSNHSGGSAVYKYELFSDIEYNDRSMCTFLISSCISPGCSIRLTPIAYSNLAINTEEGLNCGKFPICSWNTDVYTNWLTQNSVNIGLSMGSSLVSAVGGIGLMATGGGALAGAGALTSGIMGVASTIGEIYQHSLQPPQAEGNINNGDVIFSFGDLKFAAYQMSIKSEFAKIIDGFFTMYGYKVNDVHTPLKEHRTSFWYTKTIDVNIDGAIPQDDMKKIKECYNKGITFWRHTSVIGDYSQENLII